MGPKHGLQRKNCFRATGPMFLAQTAKLLYVYTRCDVTVVIDATAGDRGIKYRRTVCTRRDVIMVYNHNNNCCRKFPQWYQQPFNGLIIGFGTISWAGTIKCVQEPFLPAHHYDVPRVATSRHIAPSVNNPVDFFVTHFQRQLHSDIAPWYRT